MGLREYRGLSDYASSADHLRRNRSNFIEWFDTRSRDSIQINNHRYTLLYGSDSNEIDKRSAALDEFLLSPPRADQHSWGRTILSEIVFEDMLQRELGPVLQSYDLRVVPATTAIDSSASNKPPYSDGNGLELSEEDLLTFQSGFTPYDQKGADLIVIDSKKQALIGFDTTIGNHATVNTKRRRTPLQPFPAMPVAVLGLQNMPFGPYKGFVPFIDNVVRNNILHFGEMHLDKWRWDRKTTAFVKQTMTTGIQSARYGIKRDITPGSYPYLKEVQTKLNLAERLIQTYL